MDGSLLVEEIDVGEAKPRQVVSGLAKFCSPDDLTVFSFFELIILSTIFISGSPDQIMELLSHVCLWCFTCIFQSRHVVLITNVKPGKLRDVTSEGLVMSSICISF